MNKTFAAIIAFTGWFAVIAQLILMLQNSGLPLGECLVRFFSYFTILTNIIVATCFTSLVFSPVDKDHFFARQGVHTAITVYIIVVGLTYNILLRFLWAPQGMQRIVDELLHTVIPILSLAYWIKYIRKTTLQYKNCFTWMLFPLAYVVLVAIGGAISGFYPYPFIDVKLLGYPRALLNALGMVLIFMGLSLFLTAIGQWLRHRQPLLH
jgi:hypothetical protein